MKKEVEEEVFNTYINNCTVYPNCISCPLDKFIEKGELPPLRCSEVKKLGEHLEKWYEILNSIN